MTDLITRLRHYEEVYRDDAEKLMVEAADRIEQLEARWEGWQAREQLAATDDADHYTIMRMGELLAGVAVALKGPEEASKRHGYQDLPELAQTLVFEVAILKQQLATPVAQPPDTRTVAQIAHEVHHTCMRIPGANFYTAAEMALEQAIAIIAAPVAAQPAQGERQPDDRDAVLEEAAQVCMVVATASDHAERKHGAYSCAGKIRALKASHD